MLIPKKTRKAIYSNPFKVRLPAFAARLVEPHQSACAWRRGPTAGKVTPGPAGPLARCFPRSTPAPPTTPTCRCDLVHTRAASE